MSVSVSSRYRLADEVYLVPAYDGTARLLNLNRNFAALDKTGLSVLQSLLGLAAPAEIPAEDCERFAAKLCAGGYLVNAQSAIPAKATNHEVTSRLWLTRCWPRNARWTAWWLLCTAHRSLRKLGWGPALAVWKTWLNSQTKFADLEGANPAQRIAEAIDDIASHAWLQFTCKERALATAACCRLYGLPATVVVGVDLHPLASHAWTEFDGQVLTDEPERTRRFTPFVRYEL